MDDRRKLRVLSKVPCGWDMRVDVTRRTRPMALLLVQVLVAVACNSTLRTGKVGSGGAAATAGTLGMAGGGSAGDVGGLATSGGTVGPGVGGATDGVGGATDGQGGAVAVGGSAGAPDSGGASSASFGGGIVIGGAGAGGFAGGGGAFPPGGAGGRRGGAGGAGPIGGIASAGSIASASGGVAGQTFVGQYGGSTPPSVVVSGSEPVDERSGAPAWSPPFVQSLGTPGWRESTERLCNLNQGRETVSDVWVDGRGVFALVASACSENAGIPCGKEGATLKLNSGSGWKLYYQYTNGSFWTTRLWGGFPSGPLVTSWDYFYDLALIDDKGIAQLTGANAHLNTVFVAGDQLFYAVDAFGLSRYSSGTWTSLATPNNYARAIWADSQTVIAAGGSQTVLMGHGTDSLTQLSGVPAGAYSAVWAFSPSDIWFGNSAAQLVHYDGQKWEIHPTGSRDVNGTGGIAHLWGAEGVLYFTTNVEFGRWNGTSVEMLLTPPTDADLTSYPAQFGRFWGTSAKNVFVPLRDSRYEQYACGGIFVLWYDGSTFHSF